MLGSVWPTGLQLYIYATYSHAKIILSSKIWEKANSQGLGLKHRRLGRQSSRVQLCLTLAWNAWDEEHCLDAIGLSLVPFLECPRAAFVQIAGI